LQDLSLNALKIDRAFLKSLNGSSQSPAIIDVMVQLAHCLGMEAVAEGVEDPLRLQLLRNYDCDLAQGYLFSKPLPSHQLEALLTHPSIRYKSRLAINNIILVSPVCSASSGLKRASRH
jgi:EAL domain-containing protein (putative c-di-GMP-specific phosphodiesterase class I)